MRRVVVTVSQAFDVPNTTELVVTREGQIVGFELPNGEVVQPFVGMELLFGPGEEIIAESLDLMDMLDREIEYVGDPQRAVEVEGTMPVTMEGDES